TAIRSTPPGPASVTVERAGQTVVVPVTLAKVTRPADNEADAAAGKTETVSALGISVHWTIPLTVRYGPVAAVGETGKAVGSLFGAIVKSLGQIPGKIPALFNSLAGGKRDPNTPVSVVGASRIGGELAREGLWSNYLQ